MKTMKDFKGTKGEFSSGFDFTANRGDELEIYANGILNWIAVVKCGDGGINVTPEEARANARLFVNSKKVLEAAIEVMRFSSSLKVIADEKLQYPDNCISAFNNLEQAINDSL